MLSSSPRYLLLGSVLVSHVLSAALPWDLEGADDVLGNYEKMLQSRDTAGGWAPSGAPAMHPGQSVEDYLNNVLTGQGDMTNPAPSKDKRGYIHGNNNATTRWQENGITYDVTVIDGHCGDGVKPDMVVGPLILHDGTDKENGTAGDIIEELIRIRKANPQDEDARGAAYAQFKNKQSLKLYSELNVILDHGWICESVDSVSQQPIVLHDELRRKLLEMNKLQYYTFIIFASTASGAVVAGIQAAITHAYAQVELGAEAYFNSAVGIALSIFLACEFSRFAPRVGGAEAWSPTVLAAWGRRFVTKTTQALKRARSSGAQMAGGATTAITAGLNNGAASSSGQNIGGGASTASLQGCVTPDQAREGVQNLIERGAPLGSQAAMSMASSLGYDAGNDYSNIGAGLGGAGADCRV